MFSVTMNAMVSVVMNRMPLRGLTAILAVLLLVAVSALPSAAQPQTLIQGGVDHGGFGGPLVRFSPIDGEPAFFLGGRGGWILHVRPGHSIVLGGGGFGLVNHVRTGTVDLRGRSQYLQLGYGGFLLEYVNRTDNLVHLSTEVLIGGGGAALRAGTFSFDDDVHDRFSQEHAFFVVEPAVSVVLNVTTFFRAVAGVSYRYTSGIRLIDADGVAVVADDDVRGPAFGVGFKFGAF